MASCCSSSERSKGNGAEIGDEQAIAYRSDMELPEVLRLGQREVGSLSSDRKARVCTRVRILTTLSIAQSSAAIFVTGCAGEMDDAGEAEPSAQVLGSFGR